LRLRSPFTICRLIIYVHRSAESLLHTPDGARAPGRPRVNPIRP
jgi:hypothetical protein